MSNHDDFIAQLEDYLETFDEATPLPDRVRDAIRAELPSARQVRPRTGPLRVFTMLTNASAGARLGLAAAAIVAAVVLGAAVLNNRNEGTVGGAPTAAPTATPAPTTAPSATASPVTLKNAPFAPCDATDTTVNTCVAPGTYRLNDWPGPNTWPATVTINVPAGWFDWDAGPGADAALVGTGPNRGSSGWGVLFATVADVRRDPCDPTKGVIPAAQVKTPQELADIMASWPGFTATAPVPVTVDGHSGLKLQLTSTRPSSCNDSGMLWLTRSSWAMNTYPMIASGTTARAPGTFQIVDTGNGLLVIRTTDFAQTTPTELSGGEAMSPTRHAADLPALHAILDSIRITPLPASR